MLLAVAQNIGLFKSIPLSFLIELILIAIGVVVIAIYRDFIIAAIKQLMLGLTVYVVIIIILFLTHHFPSFFWAEIGLIVIEVFFFLVYLWKR